MNESIQFTALSEDQMRAIRAKLIDAGGDYVKAGVSLEELRNAVYTKALRVNPNIEAEDAAKAEGKAKRGRKASTAEPSTRGVTLTGDDMNDLLG